MGYHLSKHNEEILLEFLPLLRSTKDTITLETNDPATLIYILRNAAATDKYSWLSSKFSFTRKPIIGEGKIVLGVVCKIRKPSISVGDGVDINSERADLVFIVNYIIQNHPQAIRFTNIFITDSEYERLEAYCAVNQYKLTKDEKGILVIKNAI